MLLIQELIKEKIEALNYAIDNIYEVLRLAIDRHKNLFEDANTSQLNKGLLNDNNPITPEYRTLTKSIKRLKGQPIDRVTLKDTGAFHKSITVELYADGLDFDATDSKTLDLEKKYTINILGINDEDLKEILETTIIEEMQEIINI